ncbi:unnamed protein product [Ilex paraguariensis]|uniref:Uncharacterized protein n=1 Tax=Ilex paraguariensis TaxID=185542 RepID=A0ABC8SV19_9AQUA
MDLVLGVEGISSKDLGRKWRFVENGGVQPGSARKARQKYEGICCSKPRNLRKMRRHGKNKKKKVDVENGGTLGSEEADGK